MFKYVLKRVGLALLTAFIILSLTFITINLLPFEKPIGREQDQFPVYEKQVQLGFVERYSFNYAEKGEPLWVYKNGKLTYYYYQTPLFKKYFNWIGNIVTKWDWGTSTHISPNVNATVLIGKGLGYSIRINILSVIFSVPLGLALGIWAALKKNKMTDHIISTVVMILISVPSFVLISFLMSWLCYGTHLLPSQWPESIAPTSEKIKAYILPVLCLSFGSICGYCRFVRAELCEVMSSDYLLLARTKGLTKTQAIMRHALRNAMVPIVPAILAEFIGVLGGSMILENLYGIPGIGRLFVDALNAKDYGVLFVDMAIFTTISLLAGVILDISYGFVDPRIRMGAKK